MKKGFKIPALALYRFILTSAFHLHTQTGKKGKTNRKRLGRERLAFTTFIEILVNVHGYLHDP
jgi:hypothetical protein